MQICEREQCTGCGLCVEICPYRAIEMSADPHGFLYPRIDPVLCKDCGLCQRRCPGRSPIPEKETEISVYAAWNRDAKTRKSSSSGGIFSALACAVLERGGVVFGARWTEDFGVEHCQISSKEGLAQLRGSKYVQSQTAGLYSRVKAALAEGTPVLFSGTPCQVDALRTFLGHEEPLLYTVDLVCHGVPSEQIFRRYLDEVTLGQTENVEEINLRYKKPCWNYGSVYIKMRDGQKISVPTVEDPYFSLFNFNYTLRESCHHCRYASTTRTGDITLADFWGYAPKSWHMRDYAGGVSCVIANTPKGEELLSFVKGLLVFEKKPMEAAMRGNRCFSAPFPAPEDAATFWKDYEEGMSIASLSSKYVKKPYQIPKFLRLRNIWNRYRWIWKR